MSWRWVDGPPKHRAHYQAADRAPAGAGDADLHASVATDVDRLGPAERCLARVGGDAFVVVQTLAVGLVGDEAGVGRNRGIDHRPVGGEDHGEEADEGPQYAAALQTFSPPDRRQHGWAHGCLPGFWKLVTRATSCPDSVSRTTS